MSHIPPDCVFKSSISHYLFNECVRLHVSEAGHGTDACLLWRFDSRQQRRRRPPVSVSGDSGRGFVCDGLMLNVSFSYTSREGVAIKFSAGPLDCRLPGGNTSNRRRDDLESFLCKTRSDASLKNGSAIPTPPFWLTCRINK